MADHNSFTKSNSLEIVYSKKGLPIPKLEDIFIHSQYDPEKEAETFINQHLKNNDNHNFLLLGLGFGYHLENLCQRLAQRKTSYKVIVIEPSVELFENYKTLRGNFPQNVEFHVGINIETLYHNKNIIEFLTQKPSVIAQPQLLQIFNHYFQELLTYKGGTTIKSITPLINDDEVRQYFSEFHELTDLFKLPEIIKQQNEILCKEDFIPLIIESLNVQQ